MKKEESAKGVVPTDREATYARVGLSAAEIGHIEEMIRGSQKRDVGKGALTSVKVRHVSGKNNAALVVESHTCELVHAYELELDPDVICYYTQVPCRRVERTYEDGRRHITAAHLDFLVFRKDRIDLIECKHASWLRKNSHKDAGWTCEDGVWMYEPYQRWANQHGLRFSVWTTPEPFSIYLQNLQSAYAMLGYEMDASWKKVIAAAVVALRCGAMTIATLSEQVQGFTARHALWMVAHQQAFGPLRSRSLSNCAMFHLCLDEAQARAIDDLALRRLSESYSDLKLEDPLLLATPMDVAKARQRLERLRRVSKGLEPSTRRMAALAEHVARSVVEGRPELSACLTNYAKSGNHLSRLSEDQEAAIERVLERFWRNGVAKTRKDVVIELERECQRLGIPACSEGVIYRRIRREDGGRRALSTGGFRAFHAQRVRTDPRTRSLPPLGYGEILHIDSSDLDIKVAPYLRAGLPAKPKFYIGVDGATGCPMAHALIFGAARSDGLALLIREFVQRHGMLPRVVHLDRGPENTSCWIQEFCDARSISIRYSPTAGSAWNGLAESVIKQVNQQVAHRLPGSTEPDRKLPRLTDTR